MKKHCMVTCNICSSPKPSAETHQKLEPPPDSESAEKQSNDSHEQPPLLLSQPVVIHGISVPPKVDPTISQQLWKAGTLPDPEDGDKCTIHGRPNGKMLDKIRLTTEEELKAVPPVRIFCGTYT